jgi:AraC family transcriptional regulator, arabinose operon regulatory protein
MNNDQKTTLSCPSLPTLQRLGEWCDVAGHFRSSTHNLELRQIEETVLIYCVNGKGWLKLNDRKYTVKQGSLFICPPNIPHGYGCDPDPGWDIWWVHCGGERVTEYCKEAGLSIDIPVIRPGLNGRLISCFSKLLASLSQKNVNVSWMATDALHSLLLAIVSETANPSVTTNKDLMSLIDINCKSLEELAAKAGYSKYHFSRIFKEQTGQTPWEVVTERKLERAKELLLGTFLSIKEIATELGFNHPDYFARLFANNTGVTPRKYRGNFQNKNH